MKRATIEFVKPNGTFTTPSGVKLHKWVVTMDDGNDGLVFSPTTKTWWTVGDVVFYQITGFNNGMDHFKLSQTDLSRRKTERPGDPPPPNRERWMWAIQTAALVQIQPIGRPSSEYWADIEANAIRLEMMLDKLETL